MNKFEIGDRVFVEAEVDEIFAGNPEENIEYPIGISIEGDSWATCTVNGRTSFNGKKVVYTEDELRELLTAKEPKPKDELRYFYVHVFTRDVHGDVSQVSLTATSVGMFSYKKMHTLISENLKGTVSFMDIISWQELTKEDYEAFTA